MITASTGGMQIAMTQSDILLLARTLAEARGVKLATVGRLVTSGSNSALFDRLAAGHGCAPGTVDLAGAWFLRFWPRHVEWPSEVPRETPHRSA
jgi:hypothetical protein